MKHYIKVFALLLCLLLLISGCTGSPALSVLPSLSESPTTSIYQSLETTPSTPSLPTPSIPTPPSVSISSSTPTFFPTPSSPPSPTPTPTPLPPPPQTASAHFFVYDVSEGKMLALEGADQIIYPASTQKLLTILYARTILKDNEVVTPGNELSLLGANSSIAYIRPHHKLTVEQLIEGMMLPSGNDAALVLAAAAGKKLDSNAADGIEAVDVFVAGMNEYAESIGATHSKFTDPSGYNEDQYSTLEDMLCIALHAQKDALIMKYAGMAEADVVYASGHSNHWINTNFCLDPNGQYHLPEVIGLKTGALNANYSNLLVCYQIDGNIYLAGLFAEQERNTRFTDAAVVLAWLKDYLN